MTGSAHSTFQIAYPQPANNHSRYARSRYGMPFVLACLGLTLCLTASDNLLVSSGIPYNSPQGAFIFKLHPGTYLIALGFTLLILRGNPWRQLSYLSGKAAYPVLLGGIVLGCLLYMLIRFGAAGNAFFIDTLLAPALLAVILLEAPLESQRLVFWMALGLLMLNALLGIGEALLEQRLVPYLAGDQPIIEDLFRSTALGGHPLSNSLRTAVLIMACLILPGFLSVPLIFLLLIGLLAFGSRAALTFSSLFLGGWCVYYFCKGIIRRTFDIRLIFSILIIGSVLTAFMIALTLSLGLGERIFQNFYWDVSAESRLLVFKVFNYLKPEDWLLGMGPVRITEVLDQLKGTTSLTDLENFWLLLLMQLGLGGFLLLSTALLAMIFNLVWQAPPALKLSAVIFLILASTNNSLATKSQSLSILVAILIGGAAEAASRIESKSPTRLMKYIFTGGRLTPAINRATNQSCYPTCCIAIRPYGTRHPVK